jgi:hypothetical protein
MHAHHRPLARTALLVGLVVAPLALAACSGGSSTATTTTAAAPATTTSTAPSSSTTSTAASSTTSATALQNLAVTPAVRATLTATFVATKDLPASDVSGTVPNSVYYAYDPATQTSWALAQFTPSSTAPDQALVGFQDGGSVGMFTMKAGGAWTMSGGTEPFVCGEYTFFPAPVLALWGIPKPTPGEQC